MLQRPEPSTRILHVDNLTVEFEGHGGETVRPLDRFNITIAEGEITCILGPSGCGKTTLLRSLGGFVTPQPTGGVLYRGQYLSGPSPEIVLIFQENNLYPWLTVRQNIAFGIRFQPVQKAERGRIVEEMLERVGLTAAASRYPHQLSGGMRQRTAIARALVSDPRVLLLDEPFSALDINLRRRMHGLLEDIWQATGKTMVMVTHNVEEAIIVGHRVVVLGGAPGHIAMDVETRAPSLKDRYNPDFLALQQKIEIAID